ncbi:2537_t:CDS:2 [Funneliformis mosseae]|uniref:2537_t:CDS:1 n=1 Tax=Funneliformis mosseae TaxID=27381 RepID=A0A9N8W0R0_FUNMO|nr:2537_t:CDS:2 [Funneliformis mosseae]
MNDDIENSKVFLVKKKENDAHKKFFDDLEEKSKCKVDENMIINTLENCNDNEEIQSLENLVHQLANSKVVELPYYGSLKKLIDLKDEKSIMEFFDYCAKVCIEEEKLELMCEVIVLLQEFIDIPFYKSPVARLIKQLTYVKVPLKWCKLREYQSINENLYGYKIHNPKLSKFDRYQTIPQHFATMCYLPFPGLCSYPEDPTVFNALFPHKISPFAKFIITYPDEIFQASHASSEIIDSPAFHAIIKFKWPIFSKIMNLRIISTILGGFLTICIIRYSFIMYLNGAGARFFSPTMFLTFAGIVLPVVTLFLGIVQNENKILPILQALSIGFLWIGAIQFLVAFRRIGIFIIGLVIFASAHGLVVYSYKIIEEENVTDVETNAKLGKFKELTHYTNSLNAYWAGFLSDYSLWPEGDPFIYIAKVAYSLFITVVILNIMIALVNNVYTEVLNRAHTEWTMVRAQMIVIIELATMTPSNRQNRDYFPWTIFYKAFTEDVESWHQKLETDNITVSRNKIQSLDEMADEIAKMKDGAIKTKMTDKLNELRQIFS